MLLPIGHDQTTVRRMPWVSFGIIALCVLAFIYTLVAPGDEAAVAEAELFAVEYFVDHPYLELDPQLKGYVYYSLRQTRSDDVVRLARLVSMDYRGSQVPQALRAKSNLSTPTCWL